MSASVRFWHGRKAGNSPPSRRSVAILVALLLLVAPILGFMLGWYGLNPSAAEGVTSAGSYAHDLLNNFPDSSLSVEFDYVQGYEPSSGVVGLLASRISETTGKPTVTFAYHLISASQSTWTQSDLLSLERQDRQEWPTWGTMALCYLMVGGGGTDPAVLGETIGGSSIAIFPGVIEANAPGSYDAVLETVLVHEFGHELGLVGIIGSAPNEDMSHPYHSTDPNDVMYWQVETTGVLSGLFGGSGPPNQFDSADMQDLQTVRSTPIIGEILPWVVLGVLLASAAGVLWDSHRGRHGRVKVLSEESPVPPQENRGHT